MLYAFLALVVILIAAATYFDWKWTKQYEREQETLIASLQPDTTWIVRTEADNPWVDPDFIASVLDVKNGYVKFYRGSREDTQIVKKVKEFLGYYIKKKD